MLPRPMRSRWMFSNACTCAPIAIMPQPLHAPFQSNSSHMEGTDYQLMQISPPALLTG